jgi:hypothetical protein
MGRAKPIEISKFAHDAALDYLARPMAYDYTVEVRKQLIEVVEGLCVPKIRFGIDAASGRRELAS